MESEIPGSTTLMPGFGSSMSRGPQAAVSRASRAGAVVGADRERKRKARLSGRRLADGKAEHPRGVYGVNTP